MSISGYLKRSKLFYGFINLAFNQYDQNHVNKVGPDIAAAEWIVKNEGAVKGTGNNWINDFNSLSSVYGSNFKLTGIKADGIDITSGGCKHFEGLKSVKDLTLRNCVNIDDSGLKVICKNCHKSLEYLDISGTSISILGLSLLQNSTALQQLKYHDKLCHKKNHDSVVQSLLQNNPSLHITVIK